MTTDPILTLAQWLSPGFPVGAFAYSHGLETAIDTGAITDIADVRAWLVDLICHGNGHSDTVLLAAAYRADPEELADIDQNARAFCSSAERLLESAQQGAAFCRTVDTVWGTDMGRLLYPVAVGHAAKVLDAPLELTARMYLHAFAANLVSAAVRLVPLGQTEGQMLLAQLAPLIQSTADAATTHSISELFAHCFAADIASMQHETQYSKVFRT